MELVKDKDSMQKLISKLKSHRVEGITKRWLINIIGVIAVLFIICFVLSSFAIKSYYYASVENIVNSGASQSAVSYFSNNIEQGNSLESCASSYMESYSYKNRICPIIPTRLKPKAAQPNS